MTARPNHKLPAGLLTRGNVRSERTNPITSQTVHRRDDSRACAASLAPLTGRRTSSVTPLRPLNEDTADSAYANALMEEAGGYLGLLVMVLVAVFLGFAVAVSL